ncbi:MAG: hypothetical protein F6K08_20230 [Okeania sp. SIO1H6]|nr:hypothetical protein [Okeania sp. SIO1H6]
MRIKQLFLVVKGFGFGDQTPTISGRQGVIAITADFITMTGKMSMLQVSSVGASCSLT